MKKKRKEEDEIRKKQAESEGFRLEDVQKEKQPAEKTGEGLGTETLEEQDPIDQGQVQSDIDPLEPDVPSIIAVGEGLVSISRVELIPFYAH